MTTQERLVELSSMRQEFYLDETTRERRIEILLKVRGFAAEELEERCINCKQPPLGIPWEEPLIEGHCNTPDGEREFRSISGCCEFCFDKMFKDPEPLPLHRTEAGYPNCSTCDGGGCPDCTDPA